MRDNGAVIVRGEVLEVEHKSGNKNGKDWAFDVLFVQTGRSVSEVRWDGSSDSLGGVPKEGDRINVEVLLDVFNGRQQIEAKRHVPGGSRAASPSAAA